MNLRCHLYNKFVQNMNEKMQDDEFLIDVEPLLRPEVAFNPQEEYQFLYDKVIVKRLYPLHNRIMWWVQYKHLLSS